MLVFTILAVKVLSAQDMQAPLDNNVVDLIQVIFVYICLRLECDSRQSLQHSNVCCERLEYRLQLMVY